MTALRASRFASLGLALWIAAAGVPGATVPPAADPLREEDVVRWLVDGVSADEMVRRIEDAPAVAFELDEGMLEELVAAGLPSAVVAAMREAQASRARTPSPGAEIDVARLPIRLLPPGDSGVASLYHGPTLADPALALAHDPKGDREPPIQDLAFFVLCTRDTHVPDHWRAESPLGRDFVSVGRHRLLHWSGDAELLGKKDLALKERLRAWGAHFRPELLPRSFRLRLERAGIGKHYAFRLTLPETVEIALDARGGHELVAGFAVTLMDDRAIAVHLAPLETPPGPDLRLRLGGWVDLGPKSSRLVWESGPAPTGAASTSDGTPRVPPS